MFWSEGDTDSSTNHVTKGELECLHLMLRASACGLWEMCYRELVNIVLAEPHTRERQEWLNERTAYVTLFAQLNHIPHLSGLQKNQTAVLKLAICLSAFCYLFQWKLGEAVREGGTVIFYECLLGSLIMCSHSVVVQRTWTEARDDMVVKGSTISHTWVWYQLII